MIVKATRYMRNDDIRKALKITSFSAHIQKIAINLFDDLPATNNYNEAPKPRLPDSIDHPIAVIPPSRMQKTTLAMPIIEDLSRYGIEDYSYSPEAQKSNSFSTARSLD
ncbi:hypothetical protein TNCV_1165261 [Trichonephila clavipes]|nr:hypothetical protein TNCV_1165261 [Trichonephila clavipes]